MVGAGAARLLGASLRQARPLCQAVVGGGPARLRGARRLENNWRSNTAFLSPTVARDMSLGTSPSKDSHSAPEPIKFSSSKASHRNWTVDRSMGSRFQRPWWQVLPISLFGIIFLTWCILREETKIDRMLEKALKDHLPGYEDLYEVPEESEDQPGKGA
ncbi:protein CCSMST1 [Callorhinchus milii]|uniref:protein CCSMST1 n=1 Tax=Callorhinchus milii TaxID=7868 RepID=UPI0004575F98|nr:protein CCSMST1 [Callorhinchus milii]|eukprot:gi/632990221/ref/XP_007884067.1/ PREDICTED: protein CCSMST1 [Callorhinchus milii]